MQFRLHHWCELCVWNATYAVSHVITVCEVCCISGRKPFYSLCQSFCYVQQPGLLDCQRLGDCPNSCTQLMRSNLLCQSIVLADSTILDVDGIGKQGQEFVAGSVGFRVYREHKPSHACVQLISRAHVGTEELLSYVLYLVFAFTKLSIPMIPSFINPLKEVALQCIFLNVQNHHMVSLLYRYL